ncbi:biopolymer transporter ExbD [Nannocystis radixulma]|uniref:Biopolymer transporter ExbD n=1 Tax=Nannocystis radixulma TaxID=2995305 RepID=A0ABT5B449_9BACT|nr:biopolymer transporter ExbD [Nannocystis radixulma]MCY1056037.1 biopolymer transporter ExbD [Nannocystis sp. SCPEA4]MDC0668889.1 biopolymer transporter ExbD [Nannocystis radixulma]
MAADTNQDDDEGINSINVTPLVDVMLVLLIIFMVTTTKIQESEALAIDKPDAQTGQKLEPKQHHILLTCAKDGTLQVDHQPVDGDAAIKDAITRKLAEGRDLQGIIQCDEEAQVRSMIHLVDLLREAGVKKYAIATEKPKATTGAPS